MFKSFIHLHVFIVFVSAFAVLVCSSENHIVVFHDEESLEKLFRRSGDVYFAEKTGLLKIGKCFLTLEQVLIKLDDAYDEWYDRVLDSNMPLKHKNISLFVLSDKRKNRILSILLSNDPIAQEQYRLLKAQEQFESMHRHKFEQNDWQLSNIARLIRLCKKIISSALVHY